MYSFWGGGKEFSLDELARGVTAPSVRGGLTSAQLESLFEVSEAELVRMEGTRTHNFEDLGGMRLLVFYRMVRMIAREMNQMGREEPLVSFLDRYEPKRTRFARVDGGGSGMQRALAVQAREMSLEGVSIYPVTGSEGELESLRELYRMARKVLRLPMDSLEWHLVEDFTDPGRWREAVPTREVLEAFEYALLESIYEEMVKRGQVGARRRVMLDLKVTPWEAQDLVLTARYAMTQGVELDQETERKIQSHRLEKLAARAEEEMDHRLALAAIKERNRLLGLTDRPPENVMKDIHDVIARVANDAEPPLLESSDPYDPLGEDD